MRWKQPSALPMNVRPGLPETMTVLLDITLARTLDTLVARFSTAEWHGARVEAWLFEDMAARRAAEAALAGAGVQARVRSAYKPLVHAFLEEGLPSGPIGLPIHDKAVAGRFVLEAYPLAGLAGVPPEFAPGLRNLDYTWADGSRVFAPNRVGVDSHGRATLSCCGWLRVWRDDALLIDAALETEFEQAHAAVMEAVRRHDWPLAMPWFETLHIAVTTGGIHRPLDLAHECIDTREALHEDLYFSLIEVFQVRAGLAAGDRTLQPGQIVPDIMPGDGPTHIRISLIPQLAEAHPLGAMKIDTATRALDTVQVGDEMAALAGEVFAARSVQGRPIAGLYRHGTLPGLVVTAGQHANETSGVVGLLRAAPVLMAERHARVALVALENPDGYALHRHLCATHPHHMHHAARYTALGDDLEARRHPPYHEADARREALARSEAILHISLHGYPAQEWTRPLSGYVPADFAGWTVPCGFFLILRHHAGVEAQGLAFLEALTSMLATDPDLVAMNRAQLALQTAHGGKGMGDAPLLLHDIPCRVSVSDRSPALFTLITEYPDETITGFAFQRAHAVQRATVLAAADLLWKGYLQA